MGSGSVDWYPYCDLCRGNSRLQASLHPVCKLWEKVLQNKFNKVLDDSARKEVQKLAK